MKADESPSQNPEPESILVLVSMPESQFVELIECLAHIITPRVIYRPGFDTEMAIDAVNVTANRARRAMAIVKRAVPAQAMRIVDILESVQTGMPRMGP